MKISFPFKNFNPQSVVYDPLTSSFLVSGDGIASLSKDKNKEQNNNQEEYKTYLNYIPEFQSIENPSRKVHIAPKPDILRFINLDHSTKYKLSPSGPFY